ncbi:hypothetical protein [Desulfofundulus thermosubterraneus]|uniref:hypothetical protein n=1 Tax=Desulfofundulus thermosubterraneus TaxID=348840 RepID=UPI001041DE79|nr:hypothetical protein [Desulfofundulus thermosubterraneus]
MRQRTGPQIITDAMIITEPLDSLDLHGGSVDQDFGGAGGDRGGKCVLKGAVGGGAAVVQLARLYQRHRLRPDAGGDGCLCPGNDQLSAGFRGCPHPGRRRNSGVSGREVISTRTLGELI